MQKWMRRLIALMLVMLMLVGSGPMPVLAEMDDPSSDDWDDDYYYEEGDYEEDYDPGHSEEPDASQALAPESRRTLEILSPAEGKSVSPGQSLTVTWTPVEGAVEYYINYGYADMSVSGTSYTIDSLENPSDWGYDGSTYALDISVEALDGNFMNGNTIASDTVTVYLKNETGESQPPAQPTAEPSLQILSPSDGQTVPAGKPLTVTWTPVEGVSEYTFWVAHDGHNMFNTVVSGTSHTVSGSDIWSDKEHDYKLEFQVIASFSDDSWIADSIEVIVDGGPSETQPPAQPTAEPSLQILSPSDGQTVPAGKPLTITWTPVKGAQCYEIHWFYTESDDDNVYTVPAPLTSYTLDFEPRGSENYFKVLAYSSSAYVSGNLVAAGDVLAQDLVREVKLGAAMKPSQDESEGSGTLQDLLNGSYDGRVLFIQTGDFDRDGVEEAFAIVETNEYSEYNQKIINVVFASQKGVQTVLRDVSYGEEDKTDVYDLGDQSLFYYAQWFGPYFKAYLWAVENGEPIDLSSQYPGDMTYSGGNLFTCWVQDLDGWADGTVRTEKPYYFYYENRMFKEYDGRYISEEEFRQYEGAAEVLKKVVAEGKVVISIIYRSNGLIHLNLRKDGIDNSYITLKCDNQRVTECGEGGGHYKTSSTASAVTPQWSSQPNQGTTAAPDQSTTAQPEKPATFRITSPSNGQTVPADQPLTITWTPVEGATGYSLSYRDVNWSDWLIEELSASVTSYTLDISSFKNGTKLDIGVEASIGSAEGGEYYLSDTLVVTVGDGKENPDQSNGFKITYPLNDQTVPANQPLTITWTPVEGAGNYHIYGAYLCDGEWMKDSWYEDLPANTTSLTLDASKGWGNFLPGHSYKIEIGMNVEAPLDVGGYPLANDLVVVNVAVEAEAVQPVKPAEFRITSPSNGQTVPADQPLTITWTPVEGATEYFIRWAEVNWEINKEEVLPASTTSYTLDASQFIDAADHEAKVLIGVEARVDSQVGDHSLLIDGIIVTVSDGIVDSEQSDRLRITYPSNGSTVSGKQPLTITWTPVEGAGDYHVYVAYICDGVQTKDGWYKNIPVTATSFTLDSSKGWGNFLSGHSNKIVLGIETVAFADGSESLVRDGVIVDVSIDAAGTPVEPAEFGIASPSDGQTVPANQPLTITWTAEAGADHYEIVCAGESFTVPGAQTSYALDARLIQDSQDPLTVYLKAYSASGLTNADSVSVTVAQAAVSDSANPDPMPNPNASAGVAAVLSASAPVSVTKPGENITVQIVCNGAASLLDVYTFQGQSAQYSDYHTLSDSTTDANGNRVYTFTAAQGETGQYRLHFVAMDSERNWSEDAACQRDVQWIVCDHALVEREISRSRPVNANKQQHKVVVTCQKSCLCGAYAEEPYTREVYANHDDQNNKELIVVKEHVEGCGHQRYYICSCGEKIFVSGYVLSKSCALCQDEKSGVAWVQKQLNSLGYNAGTEDGVMGPKTKAALETFQGDHGLRRTGQIDDATEQALIDALTPPAPKATVNGAFSQNDFTMTAGETLDIPARIIAENAQLCCAGILAEGYNGAIAATTISGTSWNGTLQLNGAAAPFNQPGTYTIKLGALLDVDQSTWVEVAESTLVVTQSQVEPEDLQAVMLMNTGDMSGRAYRNQEVYKDFFNQDLMAEIKELAEGSAAKAYNGLNTDAASALLPTSQADFYVDTLMKQCANVSDDVGSISIDGAILEKFGQVLGIEDDMVNIISKHGLLKGDYTKEEFEKLMGEVKFKPGAGFNTDLDIMEYMWDCLCDFDTYNKAFSGNAAAVIDEAARSLTHSSTASAKLASTYISLCSDESARLNYILMKNANLSEYARDELRDALLGGSFTLQLAFDASTAFDEVMFNTSDVLESSQGAYWSTEVVDELYSEFRQCIVQFNASRTEENYDRCVAAYSVYMTYLISAYNGVLDAVENHTGSFAAILTGNGLSQEKKDLVESFRGYMDGYSKDIKYALDKQAAR